MNKKIPPIYLVAFIILLIVGFWYYLHKQMAGTEPANVLGSESVARKALENTSKAEPHQPDLCSQADQDRTASEELLEKDSSAFPESFFHSVKIDVFDRYRENEHSKEGDFHTDCDDGSLAEGWSDLVEKIFVAHPKMIQPLIGFMKQDARFQRFVTDHIDELWNANDAPKALDHVRHNCPADAEDLCKEIIHRIQKPSEGFQDWRKEGAAVD